MVAQRCVLLTDACLGGTGASSAKVFARAGYDIVSVPSTVQGNI